MPKHKSSKLKKLSKKELRARARHIKLILADCDGVLTDTGVYFGENGEVMKRFSIRDGMGTQLLREAGIETGYISGESSPALKKRAEKLKLHHVYLGIDDKRSTLQGILQSHKLQLSEIAYIGDDVNDLDVMKEIAAEGLTGTPMDGMPVAQRVAHYRCKARGGQGAFRDFAEWLLRLRNDH